MEKQKALDVLQAIRINTGILLGEMSVDTNLRYDDVLQKAAEAIRLNFGQLPAAITFCLTNSGLSADGTRKNDKIDGNNA